MTSPKTGRPLSPVGAAEEAHCEQQAMDFEYTRHLTLVRTIAPVTADLLSHDRAERADLSAQRDALLAGDVAAALRINARLISANASEDASHVSLARAARSAVAS